MGILTQKKFRFVLLLFCCLWAGQGQAQLFPPDFLCVRNDTLSWNPTLNTCGPFQSYDIYFSDNINGPFSLLVSITNPSQLDYFHSNPVNQQRFYYMESNHNCPGETKIPSPTLDNRAPSVPDIESVSIEGNQVRVEWSPSPSPETSAYIVYRTTNLGTLPIDTVDAPDTFYIDLAANPLNQSETYFILALDPCGSSSIFGLPHSSIFLQQSVDPCTQTINLNWNKYRNWENGIARQEVWLSFDNGPLELVATLDSSATTFAYKDALKGRLYSFYVEAFHAGNSFSAKSNAVELTPQLIQGVRDLDLKNVSVNTDNSIDLNWTWNTDAEIKEITFWTAPQNNNYTLFNNQTPANPLQAENSLVENTLNPQEGKKYFRIETTDLCDSTFQSNYATTIFLSGLAQENLTNQIEWTAYDVAGGSLNNYELYRTVNGQESLLETILDGQTSFSDLVDPTNEAEANICYHVIANAEYELSDGSIQQVSSRSNQTCVRQTSSIFVPNAFMPSGINTRFKPVVVFGENVDYRMVILDRWGGTLFATTDIDEGWTGRNGLRLVPGGAYTYVIQVTQEDGTVVKKTGVVVLIR